MIIQKVMLLVWNEVCIQDGWRQDGTRQDLCRLGPAHTHTPAAASITGPGDNRLTGRGDSADGATMA